MLQQQQRSSGTRQTQAQSRTQPAASRTANTSYSVMSDSTCNRRALLGQSYYDDAKKFVSQALSVDEGGDRMSALELYSKSLSAIRSGLASLHSSVGADGASSAALLEVRGKMERLKNQIKHRMEELLQDEAKARTLSQSSTTPLPSAPPIDASTMSRTSVAGRGGREETRADVLFNMDTGIGLFEVDKKEHVRKYDDVDAFTLFKYRSRIEGQPPAFLQCGGFVYPLLPGQSPILKSGGRMYMFPELTSEDGVSVGVSLESATDAEIEELDRLLSQLANLKVAEQVVEPEASKDYTQVGVAKEDVKWGSSVAGGIDKGVNWVSTKISQGTEVAGNLIVKGANKLRERIEPNEQPTEIPVSVQKGAHYGRKVSEGVVGVSDFLMTSLARLTVKVGGGLAGRIEDSEYVRDLNPHVKETWKVTKSGLKGAADVFTDLKRGACVVVKGMGQATSQTVGHKYGPQAEKVADDSLATAGNTTCVVATYWSWKTWGITFLSKVGEVVSKDSKDKKKETK